MHQKGTALPYGIRRVNDFGESHTRRAAERSRASAQGQLREIRRICGVVIMEASLPDFVDEGKMKGP